MRSVVHVNSYKYDFFFLGDFNEKIPLNFVKTKMAIKLQYQQKKRHEWGYISPLIYIGEVEEMSGNISALV